MEKKYGAFTSSQNPTEISNRVKGIVLGLSSIIIFLASHFFGITLQASDVVSLATQLSAVAGAVWTIYGFVLSVITYFTKKA